jgi:hypothetical protein
MHWFVEWLPLSKPLGKPLGVSPKVTLRVIQAYNVPFLGVSVATLEHMWVRHPGGPSATVGTLVYAVASARRPEPTRLWSSCRAVEAY